MVTNLALQKKEKTQQLYKTSPPTAKKTTIST